MPQPRPHRIDLRAIRRGLGEVLAFVASGAWAVVQFALGRWPEFPPRRSSTPPAEERRDRGKIAPYPLND